MTRSLHLYLLDSKHPEQDFPPLEEAWDEPNGLLAVGGDLSAIRLINAYRHGVFPWFGPKEPIYWWSPDPRAVIFPEHVRITRSLRKVIRNKGYRIAFDQNFPEVVKACSAPRSYSDGTWITEEMYTAYCELYQIGCAHSVEIYNAANELVGGLYGVTAGGIFCGESMFSRETNTSKIALVALAYHLQCWGVQVIDCQMENEHLLSMGAETISRAQFRDLLESHPEMPDAADWTVAPDFQLADWQPAGSV